MIDRRRVMGGDGNWVNAAEVKVGDAVYAMRWKPKDISIDSNGYYNNWMQFKLPEGPSPQCGYVGPIGSITFNTKNKNGSPVIYEGGWNNVNAAYMRVPSGYYGDYDLTFLSLDSNYVGNDGTYIIRDFSDFTKSPSMLAYYPNGNPPVPFIVEETSLQWYFKQDYYLNNGYGYYDEDVWLFLID